MLGSLIAGCAATDITPHSSQFLYGYPHVERYSTGVHDSLLCSALFLNDGVTSLLFLACDVIFVDRSLVARARRRIEQATGVPASHIMVTATHTHSGPITVDVLSNAEDPIVPQVDPDYLRQLEDGIVHSALIASREVFSARIGLTIANCASVGGNRHDPNGLSNPATPVLAVQNARQDALAALMVVCSMHPTVLHEDSTLISGDFPVMTRQYLQEKVLGAKRPVIYHTGPCGNLSPRHVTLSNTFDEARRLGRLLGQAIEEALVKTEFVASISLASHRRFVELPLRHFPSVAEAERELESCHAELAYAHRIGSNRKVLRTLECKLFGAEETLTLSRTAAAGRIADAIASTMPAEIQAMSIGPWTFIGWPGEVFVEFSLEVMQRFPSCYPISLANGELQGYLVTEEAVRERTYEALNAVFASPAAGRMLVEATCDLLDARSKEVANSIATTK